MKKPVNLLAYHIDLKRAMWRLPYLERFIRRLKQWGYNAIVCELEDKWPYRDHPALRHPDAFVLPEIASLVDFCRDQNVEIIPLMQSLGHLEYIIGKDEYACFREAPDLTVAMDVSNPAGRRFLTRLYDEVIDGMRPARFFHLGGDETWSVGQSKRLKPLLKKESMGRLYLQHMIPLMEHIRRRGLTPIIWADMILTHPEIIAEIPKYVVLMDWEYWTMEERPRHVAVWGGKGRTMAEKIKSPQFQTYFKKFTMDKESSQNNSFRAFYTTDALQAYGHRVMTAPANRSGGDLIGVPKLGMHMPNCFWFSRKGLSALGTLVTSWAVRHNHPELCLPAAFTAAYARRNVEPYNSGTVWKAFTSDFFGIELPEFARAAFLAQRGLSFCQAERLQPAFQQLQTGADPLKDYCRHLKAVFGSRQKARAFIDNKKRGYAEAGRMFKKMQKKALYNSRNFDYWMEGVAVQSLYIELILSILSGVLGKKSPYLRRLALKCRERTKALFAGTYARASVEEELKPRYELAEAYLARKIFTSSHPGSRLRPRRGPGRQ